MLPVATVISLLVLVVAAQDENNAVRQRNLYLFRRRTSQANRPERLLHSATRRRYANRLHIQSDRTAQRALPQVVHHREHNEGSLRERIPYGSIMYTTSNGSYGLLEDPNSPACKDFCLNGGVCVRNIPGDYISCNCHIHFMGERCETNRFTCPAIQPRPDEKCEGTPCSIDHDCVSPRDECCPSACGEKMCTNVNSPFIRPRSCDGFCLNGGRCWRTEPDKILFCVCPKGYIGRRCETFRPTCPIINSISDETCEGIVCSTDQDCSDRGGQCCPSACGQNLCTNVNESDTWEMEVRERQQLVDSLLEHKEPKGLMYYERNGSWGLKEDSNSPSCKDFCLNNALCVRNFPKDELTCTCRMNYTGKRCENLSGSCFCLQYTFNKYVSYTCDYKV